ncbi:MAG: hypothetical protein J7559_08555, partial [Cohnella sp.]|nr:hypothetical protein [Cohnella sp.]
AAIKALPGYGNDSFTVNPNHDHLVAEYGWYSGTNGGDKYVSISNTINVTNNSSETLSSIHYFDANDRGIGSVGSSIGSGGSDKLLVNKQATKIVFYVGSYTPNVTPTSGKMRIIHVDGTTINGIELDDSNWIQVDATNFGQEP